MTPSQPCKTNQSLHQIPDDPCYQLAPGEVSTGTLPAPAQAAVASFRNTAEEQLQEDG